MDATEIDEWDVEKVQEFVSKEFGEAVSQKFKGRYMYVATCVRAYCQLLSGCNWEGLWSTYTLHANARLCKLISSYTVLAYCQLLSGRNWDREGLWSTYTLHAPN